MPSFKFGDRLGDVAFRLSQELQPSFITAARLCALGRHTLLPPIQQPPPLVGLSKALPSLGLGFANYLLCFLPFQSLPFSKGLPLSAPTCSSMAKINTANPQRSSPLHIPCMSVPSFPFLLLHIGGTGYA